MSAAVTTRTVGSIVALMSRVLAPLFVGPSWDGWRALIRVLAGEPLTTPEERAVFERLTARVYTHRTYREAWIIAGRRAGKSRVAALMAVYATTCRTYTLAPGEVGVFMVVAADRRQARVVKRYIAGLLRASPVLEALIASETKEAIVLITGLVIEIHTASFRTLRGYTVVGAICDEIAFWASEDAADPDVEILTALRAAMATVPEALLLCISSPYARRGEPWRIFRKYFGHSDAAVLVVQAPTPALNPTIPQADIDRAFLEDPVRAASEWHAEFRGDVETFITRVALDAAVVPGRLELPPRQGVGYVAFLDPAGSGSVNADSFTAAIAHRGSDQRVIVDAIFERRPPFSPEATVAEIAGWLRRYEITTAISDRYAAEWPVEQFRKYGITVVASEKTKSELYREFLPMLNSGQVELLDHPRMVAQFAQLERRVARGGKDSIDHAPGAHDDVANAVAGVVAARGAFTPHTMRILGF